MKIPVIDISPLFLNRSDLNQVVSEIAAACREVGFFYITGHGVDMPLQRQLEQLSREFFSQALSKKLEMSMDFGGKAWRGYFPLEGELTSGKPDVKEGLYFGEDLPMDHPMVTAGVPLHGSNLYPDIPGFEQAVLDYMYCMTNIGAALMRALALGLELPIDYFGQHLMANPIKLFRIFHYPVPSSKQQEAQQWGVGEHTDYGMLTILKQDDAGGLQVFTGEKWTDAPFIKNSFVCNIGDMLDYLTGGYYRSTPHRVLNTSDKSRLSFPFFYDLDFDAIPIPIDLNHLGHAHAVSYTRWDQSELHTFNGTYGEYLLSKVSKVFPQLRRTLL